MEEIAEFEIFENDVEEQHAEKCNSKVSCWVGTWNNPSMSDEEFEKFLQDLESKNYLQYAIFQREQGEETGTIHFQFFVHFKNARSLIVVTLDGITTLDNDSVEQNAYISIVSIPDGIE